MKNGGRQGRAGTFVLLGLAAGVIACGPEADPTLDGHRAAVEITNLVANPSVETISATKPSEPANWRPASWGTNTVSFTHDATDAYTGSRSIRIHMPSWSSGDAKWIFDSIAVTPGATLIYRDYYKSTITTKLVAAYQLAGGTMSYATLAYVPARASWSPISASLIPPAGATRVTVYHLIAGVGNLQLDEVSLAPPQTADLSSGVPNGSLEQASDLNPGLPLAWLTGTWGTSSASFAYVTGGHTGARSVAVTLANYVSGDAKWYFVPQPVTPGVRYQYSDYYIATAASFLSLRLTMSDGTYRYVNLGQVPAASSFAQAQAEFLAPVGAVAATMFHGLSRNGTLQIDDAALSSTSLVVAPPVLSPAPGSYETDQSVTIGCSTSGATIHYTLDGSAPTASSPVYAAPISISGPSTTVTIRAIARKDQMLSSSVEGTYTVVYPPVSPGYRPTPKVVFTFDVSSRALYERALPIFAAHGMPAVYYAETAQLNSGESWVMSWQQVRDLQNVYGWEVGSHTINHPYLTQVSDAQLDQELRDSKGTLVANGLNVTTFATPYGAYNLRVLAAVAKYYESHRAAWGGPNVWPSIYNDYEVLCYELDVHEDGAPTVAEVKQWIEDAIAHNQTLVILLHEIVPGVPQMYEYNENDLRAVLDYVATRPIQVTTMTAALQYSTSANLVSNPSFTALSSGWATDWQRSDSTNVTIDTGSHGNVSGAANSAKLLGGTTRRELSSALIPVSGTSAYLLRMYQNVQNWTAGGWSVSVEERNASDAVLNVQTFGAHSTNFVGDRYYEYRPTSTAVARVRIVIYTEAGSQLTLYVDSVELKRLN